VNSKNRPKMSREFDAE